MLAGCSVSPNTELVYTNALTLPKWPGNGYSIVTTGGIRSTILLLPKQDQFSHAKEYFSRFKLESGIILDGSEREYFGGTFSASYKDSETDKVSAVWVAGDDQLADVVIRQNECESYLTNVRLFNEPIIKGCGVQLVVTSYQRF
jgi:hypothetical protein